MFKPHCTVCLYFSEESLICKLVCMCPTFIISSCRAGAEYGIYVLRCFVFFRFSDKFSVIFWKIGASRSLFECRSVVSEFKNFLKKQRDTSFPVCVVWLGDTEFSRQNLCFSCMNTNALFSKVVESILLTLFLSKIRILLTINWSYSWRRSS